MTTRHPLWDEHEEEEDPTGERVLDQDRLTLSSTWLDAEMLALARMPEDTILPLLLALGFFVLFVALTFECLWLALATVIYSFAIAAAWFWPKPQEGELV